MDICPQPRFLEGNRQYIAQNHNSDCWPQGPSSADKTIIQLKRLLQTLVLLAARKLRFICLCHNFLYLGPLAGCYSVLIKYFKNAQRPCHLMRVTLRRYVPSFCFQIDSCTSVTYLLHYILSLWVPVVSELAFYLCSQLMRRCRELWSVHVLLI